MDHEDSDSTASLVECSFDEDKWNEPHHRRVQDDSTTGDEMMGEVAGIMTHGDAAAAIAPTCIEEWLRKMSQNIEGLSPVIAVVPKIKINIQDWGLETDPSASAMEETEEEGFSQSLFDEIISKKNVHSSEEAKDLVGVGEGMIIKPPSDREEVVQQEMEPDYENSGISLISGNVVSVYRPLAHTSESSAAEDESQRMLQMCCVASILQDK